MPKIAQKIPPKMMKTQSTNAGSFKRLDLTRVPSPCFVVDEIAVRRNLEILADIAEASRAKILAALKAFSFFHLAPLISQHLSGTCASGLWEAKLARKYYTGALSVFAPAYKPEEIDEIATLCDHVIFNSPAQVSRFGAAVKNKNAQIGLRLNPEYSENPIEKYDPCAHGSRLGLPISKLAEVDFSKIDALHLHSLCEQGLPALKRTWQAIEPQLKPLAGKIKWLNLGGGHLITHPDYDRAGLKALLKHIRDIMQCQIYLEPGTAVAFDAGILVGQVLDVMENDGANAILDISAICHMPDVLDAPYRPALMQEMRSALMQETPPQNHGGIDVRLGGASCLAGDQIGTYRFAQIPQAGTRLAFLDQAHYSMVRTTSFNGVALPALALWNSQTDALNIIREFSFEDFERRLS